MDRKDKLAMWQERLGRNESAYSDKIAKMDVREELYRGSSELKPLTDQDLEDDGSLKTTPHRRNIIMENIESQVSSSIPQPKVRPLRGKIDEAKAKLIEDMIRNELDRLPMEEINDMMERIVPVQGGGAYLVEWDNTKRTHLTVGEISVTYLHPKQIIPQDGVYTGIEDMDYIIIKLPQTKGYIKRKYGVDVDAESETEPEIKGSSDASTADDMVTQYIGLQRNDNGGIDLYSWINNTELEDIEDYQARRLKRCAKCGAAKQIAGEMVTRIKERDPLEESVAAAELARMIASGEASEYPAGVPLESDAVITETVEVQEGICPYCGSEEWTEGIEEYEEIYREFVTGSGIRVPGATYRLDENGKPYLAPTKIPFYKPDVYPIVLQKNTSVFGEFLGESDVDKIADQQNTVNRMERKIIDQLISAGTMITLPPIDKFTVDPKDAKKIYLANPEAIAYVKNIDLTGDITPHMSYLQQAYEEARQILGITDSFQGRRDTTAKSGVAKQFAAAQTAGRLESKRVMKDAAYARLFELIFKFKLAYADEPRPVVATDEKGEIRDEVFNRYDFLEVDEAGEYWWNDLFLFSCDTSAPLANNREQMWENTTAQLQAGCFGDPTKTETLILYWTKMELLHYPGAAETKKYLAERLAEEKAALEQQMSLQQRQLEMQRQQLEMETIRKAREDAMKDAGIRRPEDVRRQPLPRPAAEGNT